MRPELPVPAGLRGLIASAAEPLHEARQLLREPSPQNVYRCSTRLGEAIPRVEAVRDALASMDCRDPGLAGAIAVLVREVAACGTLLKKAAAFHGELLQHMVDASASVSPAAPSMQLEA